MSNEVMKSDAFQKKVKTMLGLTYLTRAKLDGFILIQIVIVEQLQEASITKSYLFLMNE